MEENKLLQFKKQIVDEVKDLFSDEECWELISMLYLIMQEELFVVLLKHSNYQGTSGELLEIIETDDEMKMILKTSMIEFINEAHGHDAVCMALVILKDHLTRIQVQSDETEEHKQS